MFDDSAAYGQRPRFATCSGTPAARRTGVEFRELVGVPIQQGFQSALSEGLSGLGGDLFHGGEVDIEARAVGSEGPFGDHLAEVVSEDADGLQIFRSQLASCHV